MKQTKYIGRSREGFSRAAVLLSRLMGLFLLVMGWNSCTDFVEVEPPKNVLVSGTVFDDPATVESALANIYYRIREQGMVSGNEGMTLLMGVYADELDYYGFDTGYAGFYNHTVLGGNDVVLAWWSHAYNLIYAANDILIGVMDSSVLTTEEKNRYMGQALFVRAYMHGLLANLFGDIPYITTTDYRINNEVSRMPLLEVYGMMVKDLNDAMVLLDGLEQNTSERVLPDKDVAKALLARTYLYMEEWELAVSLSSELLEAYDLEPDVEHVFLRTSSETLWQLKPGDSPRNTQEANQLVIQFIPGQSYALTNVLLEAFEPGDLRYVHWVGSQSNTDSTVTLYYAHKYKALFSEMESLEYPILFRLAEQYLIRAEARAHIGNLSGSQEDINALRNRAGLSNTMATTQDGLMDAIVQERRVELFAELGHRWFDLKRTESAGQVLGPLKVNWRASDVLLPIPENELEANPNLAPQNEGY